MNEFFVFFFFTPPTIPTIRIAPARDALTAPRESPDMSGPSQSTSAGTPWPGPRQRSPLRLWQCPIFKKALSRGAQKVVKRAYRGVAPTLPYGPFLCPGFSRPNSFSSFPSSNRTLFLCYNSPCETPGGGTFEKKWPFFPSFFWLMRLAVGIDKGFSRSSLSSQVVVVFARKT